MGKCYNLLNGQRLTKNVVFADVDEFRGYMKSGRKENKKTKHLKETFVTLTVSSAKCRHVFRAMNAILTKQRASMYWTLFLQISLYIL